MPGLGTSFGRGGATTFLEDLQNADCIVIAGSNFAECHPVGFRFVMKAKERGAAIVHVDPRFTRTSAMADLFVPIRTGTDIAFLGGVINWVLSKERFFREYVLAYTNASYILDKRYRDAEDGDGIFSGFHGTSSPDQTTRMPHMAAAGARTSDDAYDPRTWDYEYDRTRRPKRDDTLAHERCVLNALRRHFARYTPKMVERICGTPQPLFERVCTLLCENSGRERTSAFAYAVGWTQHTVGVQYIRTAAILQLLLGNIGRPGGGIMALRGHANIQGATDIGTLYDLLPGYIPMPAAERDEQTLRGYLASNTKPAGVWSNFPRYAISLLKAFYGEAATAANDYCFEYLPQVSADHSTLPTQVAMNDGRVQGYFVIGQNPAASGINASQARVALERLEWMVNLDAYETETASFWRREGSDPKTIGTECFFIPTATVLEKDGTMTNTNRLLQWHDKALEPAGQSITDLAFIYRLGHKLKELYGESRDPKDRPIRDLTWNYGSPDAEPSALRVLQEINGCRTANGELLHSFDELRDDGSTACGCWIYCGVTPDAQTNRARSRQKGPLPSAGWGFSWPANRRMLYNRASADGDGKPWSERKKYLWWNEERGRWDGPDVPDFPAEKSPHTAAQLGMGGMAEHSGSEPFIMQLDGRGQLFVGGALKDGPFPTHYEPFSSPVANALYAQNHNPVAREWKRRDNRYNGVADARFPYVLTTYRLTEMSGIMTRYVPWLAELQPVLFCELDPELAVALQIRSGDWCTVSTALGEIEARALVSGRLQPLHIGGKRTHQVGIPYNYGPLGFARGDSAGDLVALSMDPNVSIHEAKTLTCDVGAGRRARNGAHPPRTAEKTEATIHGRDA